MLINVDRLQAKMDEQGLDGLVATSLPNVQYIAGFWSPELADFPYSGQVYALITRDRPTEPFVVTPNLDMSVVLDGYPTRGTIGVGTFYREGPFAEVELTEEERWLKAHSVDAEPAESPLEGLITALERLGLADKAVGVDEDQLRPGTFEALGEKLPRATFTPAAGLLREVRQVKTAEEIRCLRAVVHMTEQALRSACAIVREGITAVELVREFERSIVSQGGLPRFAHIQIGRNAVYLAGTRVANPTPLRKGDTVWCDTGAVYQGYWSDIARIISLGEPSPRASRIYNALLAGERAGIAGTQLGRTGAEIFEIVMQACREAGHPEYRRHHVGHSIGLEVYESPMLSPTSHTVIEENMVINIETPYYEFGLGAFAVEDPYVVKADRNHDLLTTLTRELIVVEP